MCVLGAGGSGGCPGVCVCKGLGMVRFGKHGAYLVLHGFVS